MSEEPILPDAGEAGTSWEVQEALAEAIGVFSTLPVEGWSDYLIYLLEGLEDLAGDTPAFEGMLQELRERITARLHSGRWGEGNPHADARNSDKRRTSTSMLRWN